MKREGFVPFPTDPAWPWDLLSSQNVSRSDSGEFRPGSGGWRVPTHSLIGREPSGRCGSQETGDVSGADPNPSSFLVPKSAGSE